MGALQMFPLIRLIRAFQGYDQYSAETLDRLINSAHVKDLRLIVNIATILVLAALVAIAYIAYSLFYDSKGGAPPTHYTELYKILMPLQAGAVLAGLGGIVAWCYQTGNARLGTVDLFACEIATLCRIWTVNSVVENCIEAYEFDLNKKPPPVQKEVKRLRERFAHFDSSEKYTPIFDANAKELRNLNVKVLTNMTAFYTYWKATSDASRNLASVTKETTGPSEKGEVDLWHRTMRHLIYMQFLACESARKAVRDLIEFEPNNAENAITILLSELSAYQFLMKRFEKEDVRHARLELRRERYRTVVPKIYCQTRAGWKKFQEGDVASRWFFPLPSHDDLDEVRRDWDKAHKMLPDLRRRYKRIFVEFPSTYPSQRRRAAQARALA